VSKRGQILNEEHPLVVVFTDKRPKRSAKVVNIKQDICNKQAENSHFKVERAL